MISVFQGCEELVCADLGVERIPDKVTSLLTKRSGGSPLLCMAIAHNLVDRGALQILPVLAAGCNASCKLGSSSSERLLQAAATEALVGARHSFLCVKLAELSMFQQLILKTMSLLQDPCSQSLLVQALPIQVDAPTLGAQMKLLREHHLIRTPTVHRLSLPGVLNHHNGDFAYSFVDVGMREVRTPFFALFAASRRLRTMRATLFVPFMQLTAGLSTSDG